MPTFRIPKQTDRSLLGALLKIPGDVEADWAKQHADEEFRNRARILDIGRTAWLLEAVRDAPDNGKELPADLVKELSRNLFTYSATEVSDLHPQAVSDLLMQGLNSLRVKGPDGSEIEAKRGKG